MALTREVVTPGPGQCLLHNMGGRLFIERADPVVAITRALAAQVSRGEGHPDLSLDGNRLVIDASNQRAVYELGPSGHAGFLLGRLC